MRSISIKTAILILITGISANAQQGEDDPPPAGELVKTVVYINGSRGETVATGKMIDKAAIDLYLVNVNSVDNLVFDPTLDNLYIKRYGRALKSAMFDYGYTSPVIGPRQQVKLHFYLPINKGITENEILYLTYNANADTMIISATEDPRVERYVKNTQGREMRRGIWKTIYAGIFAAGAIGLYSIL